MSKLNQMKWSRSGETECPRRDGLRWNRGLGWLLGMLLGGANLWATQGPAVPLEALAQRADTVVHARVESVETQIGSNGRQYTRVELVPMEIWKGPATNRIGLVMASGVLGERWVKVVGEPDYRPGEEVVVFAVNNERGESVTLELSQGKFLVTRSSGQPGAWVCNGVFGSPAETAANRVRPPHQLPLTVDELRERVRRILTSSASEATE